MRPQDIEKLASSVVSGLSRPTRACAGCGGTSDPNLYNCGEYSCGNDSITRADYECGGAGAFECDPFFCALQFSCPTNFFCQTGYSFD